MIRSRCPSVRVLLREGGPSGVGRARLSVGLRLFSLTHTILSTLERQCVLSRVGRVGLAELGLQSGCSFSCDDRRNPWWSPLRQVQELADFARSRPTHFSFSAVVGAGQVIARLLPLFSSLPSGCYPHPSSARYASRRGAPFGRLGALSRCLPPARSRRSCLGRRGGSYRAVRARWHRLLRFASPHWHGEVALGLRRH